MELAFFQSKRARNKIEWEVKVSQMAGRTMEKNEAGRGEAMAEEVPASWLDLALGKGWAYDYKCQDEEKACRLLGHGAEGDPFSMFKVHAHRHLPPPCMFFLHAVFQESESSQGPAEEKPQKWWFLTRPSSSVNSLPASSWIYLLLF